MSAAETAPLSAASYSSLSARHLTSSWGKRAVVAEQMAQAPVVAAAALLIRALCCLPRAEAAAAVLSAAAGTRESALAERRAVRRVMAAGVAGVPENFPGTHFGGGLPAYGGSFPNGGQGAQACFASGGFREPGGPQGKSPLSLLGKCRPLISEPCRQLTSLPTSWPR
jgi:hypothetical protein